ncbi:MAG TPA: nucleoside hydrolase [Bryobacteraceae bacterium]|nr:nucleoside hydrolase [Bryobacteraceae bacterium]
MRRLLVLCTMPFTLSAVERMIVDTDCGYFGDDGSTLTMLLRSPEKVRVEAITIVSGNVWSENSARYTQEILKLLGRSKIPIYMGAEMPLKHTAAMADEEQRTWGGLEFRGAFSEPKPATSGRPRGTHAAMELIRRIQAAPGTITLVALGPLTNIAIALRQEPEIAGKIRRLVFMGGQYRVPGNATKEAEFNFWFDPEAAQMVLRSSIQEKVMFGLDVCNKALLDKRGFDQIVEAETPLTDRFREDFGVRYPGFLKDPEVVVPLWDSLVSAWLIEPSLFGTPEMLHLDVDAKFGRTYGKVIDLDRKLAPGATPVAFINDVKPAEVYQLFRDLLRRRK